MRRRALESTALFVLGGALAASACGDDGAVASPTKHPAVVTGDAGQASPTDAAPSGTDEGHDASVDATLPPLPCAKAPCAARPIVFVHGFTGDNSDFAPMMSGLVATDGRWDGFKRSGTEDHLAWAPRSIDRRSWLFAFDYYVKHDADGRGSYTAGPGRIGSNKTNTCLTPNGAGRILPDTTDYQDGVVHDYAEDLASYVASIQRATGANEIDVVAHSMGGLVTRSFTAFYGGDAVTHRVLLLASPVVGVSLIGFLEYLPFGHEDWMTLHEVAELDAGSVGSRVHFTLCDTLGRGPGPWGGELLHEEIDHPPPALLYVMSGANDPLIHYDMADHPLAQSHDVVPGVDHGGILKSAEAQAKAAALLGGTF